MFFLPYSPFAERLLCFSRGHRARDLALASPILPSLPSSRPLVERAPTISRACTQPKNYRPRVQLAFVITKKRAAVDCVRKYRGKVNRNVCARLGRVFGLLSLILSTSSLRRLREKYQFVTSALSARPVQTFVGVVCPRELIIAKCSNCH